METSKNSSFGTGYLLFACLVNAYLLLGLGGKEQQTEPGHQPDFPSAEKAREEMDHEPYYIDLD